MIRFHVIKAVTRRNFASYFSGVLGYLFIVVFCVASSVMAFTPTFFAANQANLDQLSATFPLLLLFIIPAITMSAWADERKLGTDELLFTAPASESEILLGKYLAVVGVYSVALLFSLVNVGVLAYLGDPDLGLIFSNYFGYWLSGCTLLAVGMFASSLTSSATVAFVLAVIFCCVPVFVGLVGDITEWVCNQLNMNVALYDFREALARLSLDGQLADFGMGVIPLTSLWYFATVTVVMLYLNLVAISRRRWSADRSKGMSFQFGVRAGSVAMTGISILYLLWLWPARADLTSENLYTLSDVTEQTFEEIGDNKVTIQVFMSAEVPRQYAETKRTLDGVLREFSARGGNKVEVRRVVVEPSSAEAEDARAQGINPQTLVFDRDGRTEEREVFLGAVVQCNETVEIPFFGEGLPVEYELTRSLRTAMEQKKVRIGVLQTDARFIEPGGESSWELVNELRKQYQIVAVDPNEEILVDRDESSKKKDAYGDGKTTKQGFDVMLAVMPSSLTEPEMVNFMAYIESGRPALVFDDPYPMLFTRQGRGGERMIQVAPGLPKPPAMDPMQAMMMGRQPPPQPPKADGGRLTRFTEYLRFGWNHRSIIFDGANPHTDYARLPSEFAFISRQGIYTTDKIWKFSSHPVTAGLHDLVCMYTGFVTSGTQDEREDYKPLLRTSTQSGELAWESYTDMQQGFQGPSFILREDSDIRHVEDKHQYEIAVHVKREKDDPANVIFVSDIDMIHNQFFALRMGGGDITFDNVTFVLNAVDVLAGKPELVELRSRRAALRTLTHMEKKTAGFRTALTDEIDKRQKALDKAVEQFDEQLKKEAEELAKDSQLDRRSLEQQAETLESQRNLKVQAERKKQQRLANAAIRKARIKTTQNIRNTESSFRAFAWFVPAILPICFGLLFLGLRNLSEQSSISANRRV